MTSWQQVARLAPRLFNHQDCHHNGRVGHWFTKEGCSVWRSEIRCVSASNSLETEERTRFPLFPMISDKTHSNAGRVREYLAARTYTHNINANRHEIVSRRHGDSSPPRFKRTKQAQMALRFWTPSTIYRQKKKGRKKKIFTIDQTPARTQSSLSTH